MGNEGQKSKGPTVAPPVRPIEIKTYVMSCQTKMSLYRNKKIYEIKKKKDEAISALKQNNLDIAKAKMESIIRLEDTITVYDILGPLCEILKERITYLCEAQEVPPDIKAQLDTIIYASSRIDVDDLYQLRNLVLRKFGSYYIEAADQNKDGLVNVNVIEKLKIKPPVDAFLTIRLKQLCKERKFNYEFPEEIAPSFDQGMGMDNQFGGQPNPYDPNYCSSNNGMGNNPYGPGPGGNNFGNNNNNPYSMGNNMGPGNDFDSYMRNNGPGMGPGGNPYNAGNNGNNQFGNNGGNPYDTGNNPYSNNNTGGNPFNNNNDGGNPFNNNNAGGNPFNNGGGNPYEGDMGGNPYA